MLLLLFLLNYYFLLLLSLFLSSLLFSWCAVLTNTPGLRDPVVMRVLSDFYWTAATGAGLFMSNSAQRHADHCVQAARAFCWEQVSLTWIPVGTECWLLIRSGKYPDAVTWACTVRIKARFVLLICKLSPGVVTLYHFLPKLSVMGPMGFTHIGDWVGRGMSDDFSEEFRRCNPELPRVTRAVLCAKYFLNVWLRFETQLAQYRVNYAHINEPQTPWRNVHGPKQMIVSTPIFCKNG